MRYRNCFTGAIGLMFKLKSVRLKVFYYRGDLPHFYVVDKNNHKWHYAVERDFLPFPIGLLIYKGKHKKLKKRN